MLRCFKKEGHLNGAIAPSDPRQMEFFSLHLYSLFGFVLAILLVGKLMREHRPPGSTMAWLLAILLIPYLGVPLYLLLGGRKIRRLAHHKQPLYPDPRTDRSAPPINDVEKILTACGAPPASSGNKVELLSDGEIAYRRFMEMIDGAKESICVTTFILGRDPVGRAIIDALTEKAKQGVKVRLLLDALGSVKTRGRFVKSLREAGGQVGIFMPMLPLRRKWSANLRNHRKLFIVDGRFAIVGGMNLGSPYMGEGFDPRRWFDFAVTVEGPAVTDITSIFASDWEFATGEALTVQAPNQTLVNSEAMQVVASGPDVESDPFYQALLIALNEAKERVWIVTPYFIPDDLIARQLALLARIGRDIRIILPARSNHLLADLAGASYIRQLKQSGVKFYAFQPGMLHAKIVIVDDSLAVVGSANIDLRSLYLNYEIALFIYSDKEVQAILSHAKKMMLRSFPLEAARPSLKTGVKEWVEDASRILAPLL